jgi:hypothetical protein
MGGEGVGLSDAVELGDAPWERVAVGDGVSDPEGVPVGVPLAVALGVEPCDKVAVGVAVLESVTVSVGEGVTEGVRERDSEEVVGPPDAAGANVGDVDTEGGIEVVGVLESGTDTKGVTEGPPDAAGTNVGDADTVRDIEGGGVLESDTEGEVDGDTPGRDVFEAVGVPDNEREGVGVSEAAVSSALI